MLNPGTRTENITEKKDMVSILMELRAKLEKQRHMIGCLRVVTQQGRKEKSDSPTKSKAFKESLQETVQSVLGFEIPVN